MFIRTRHALLVAIAASPAVAGAPNLILDDFDADPNDDAGGPRTSAFTVYDDPFNQGGSFALETTSNFGSDVGGAVFNSGAGAEHQLVIGYGDDTTGLNLDTGALGWIGFELDFAFVDQDFEARIRLNTNAASGSTSATASFIVSGVNGDQTVFVALNTFNAGGSFDFADVDRITLTLNPNRDGTPALNFILTEFRAVVPVPGSAALLGLAGLGVIRRRR